VNEPKAEEIRIVVDIDSAFGDGENLDDICQACDGTGFDAAGRLCKECNGKVYRVP
jgi:DnaJ-class molecular chaperone